VNYSFFKTLTSLGKSLAFVLLFMPLLAVGQYANDWINFNQPYVKVSVARDGIYKLTYADLQAANFPVNSVDPRLIKLYHRGIEQAILVQGEADAIFNPTDFIEFYGQRNDGTLDKNLYRPVSSQPHGYYNLYSDTTAYFLTYSFIPPGGKRVASFSEVNVANLPKEEFHNEERLLVLGTNYSAGATSSELQNTFFDEGEGWFGNPLQQGQSVDYLVDLLVNGQPPAGVPTLSLQLAGRDAIPHTVQIQVGGSSFRTLSTVEFFGFETPTLTFELDWSDFRADGKTVIRLSAAAATTNRFQFSAAYIKITFPQLFDAAGLSEKKYYLAANASGKSVVEIDNAAPNSRLWDVTDPTNLLAIGTQSLGAKRTAVVPQTEEARTLLMSTVSLPPISIKPVAFRSFQSANANYIIITNKALQKPALAYADVVKAYAAYRASAAGGKYDTLIVSVDQLYDQFNYGETSSLAIYEFMKMMVETGNPKHLFIIGKGRDIYSYSGYKRIAIPPTEVRDLVPTAGSPASDAAFTADLGGTTVYPTVSTGRLPATTPAHVAAYLNKIIETEAAPVASEWKKQGLHLSGGIRASELPLFRSYVDGFKSIASGDYWGANITTIGKQESNPVQLINVSDQVNKGTNLITFFGHSSPGTIDIDIGFVTDPILGYNNPGKYPVFLINGCNAGAFFTNGSIFGEDWILAANKGARNFIAHSSFGFSNTLRSYSELFYQVGFADSVFLRMGIGEVQQEVAKRYLAAYGDGIFNTTQIQQSVLLGDPAVKLFGTNKPDYEIENSNISLVSLDGAPVTSLSNQFGVKIIRKNGGASGIVALPIRVIRTFADNTSITYDSVFSNVVQQDTVIFKLKREAAGAGLNQFTVLLDPLNTITETNELNNSASLSFSLPSNSTRNLFPSGYAIVNKQNLNLVFQATDQTSASRDFQIQLDTTYTFDSPFLKSQKVSGSVLAKFMATLANKDSTTYYWRTKFDKPIVNESSDWVTSSFSYIKNGEEGWGQLQFPQLLENSVTGLLKDAQEKKLKYVETIKPFSVTTFGSGNPTPIAGVSLKIDNVEYNIATQGQPCRNHSINLVAFNKNTVVPYAGIPFSFQDPRTCGRQPQLINSFVLSELETGLGDDLAAYVDAIQQSDSVVIFSIGNPGYQSWSANVKNKLGNFGISATQINELLNGEPIVILGRKGASPGTAKVFKSSVAPVINQTVSVNKTITGRFSGGSIKSTLLGPAKAWVKFVAEATSVEGSDEVSYAIYGITLAGNETLLQNNMMATTSLAFIDPVHYPYVRVELKMKDEVNLTAVQLKKWMVLYETVADGMLIYKGSLAKQTVQEGQNFNAKYGFVNYSDKPFFSQLTVKADVLSKNSGITKSSQLTIAPPLSGDTTSFEIAIDSKNKVGANDVTVFVNPRLVPEQVYDNNLVYLSDYLTVVADRLPPILNVTIDGRIVKNGDFVSRSPLIVSELKDENPFLYKTDTVGIKMFLKLPCATATCAYKQIYFSQGDVTWSPATETNGYAVIYNPQELAVGSYTFRVEAEDESGNKSGVKPYEIEFKVTEVTDLKLVSAYPNPSASYFYFSFILSGNVLPSDFSLQIFSLDGRLLSDFTTVHINQFIIGVNELVWNATDVGGNPLPSGVYAYRLSIMANGKSTSQTGRLVLAK
jgi:hypothetical protein